MSSIDFDDLAMQENGEFTFICGSPCSRMSEDEFQRFLAKRSIERLEYLTANPDQFGSTNIEYVVSAHFSDAGLLKKLGVNPVKILTKLADSLLEKGYLAAAQRVISQIKAVEFMGFTKKLK